MREIIADWSPEIVIHLAAQAGVRYSMENPAAYLSSNLIGTQTLLEELKGSGVRHILIASTSSTYGGNAFLPFQELHPTHQPMSLYAATKIGMEALAHSYSHLWDLPTTCFRFFTVYGPWGRPDMALFKFVNAIERDEPIDVYGYGRMMRDFTYIDDLVHAVERLTETAPARGERIGAHDSLSTIAPYRVVNIGGGQPVQLLDFIDAVEQALGKNARRNMLPMQPGDVVATSADARLLRDLIGIIPSTPVDLGVAKFVEWFLPYRHARSGEALLAG